MFGLSPTAVWTSMYWEVTQSIPGCQRLSQTPCSRTRRNIWTGHMSRFTSSGTLPCRPAWYISMAYGSRPNKALQVWLQSVSRSCQYILSILPDYIRHEWQSMQLAKAVWIIHACDEEWEGARNSDIAGELLTGRSMELFVKNSHVLLLLVRERKVLLRPRTHSQPNGQ